MENQKELKYLKEWLEVAKANDDSFTVQDLTKQIEELENQNEPIATINGVDVYTDGELLKVYTESFSYPQLSYIDVFNISDKVLLQGAHDMLDDYKNALETLMDAIETQIEILEDEENN
jgi:hypothetical protein